MRRFIDQDLTQAEVASCLAAFCFEVIEDERHGRYQGRSVQSCAASHRQDSGLYPKKPAKGFDVHIVEIGGTVGIMNH